MFPKISNSGKFSEIEFLKFRTVSFLAKKIILLAVNCSKQDYPGCMLLAVNCSKQDYPGCMLLAVNCSKQDYPGCILLTVNKQAGLSRIVC